MKDYEARMGSWEVIREMDNEDGTPTCYGKKFGKQQWWVTKYPNQWIAETKVRTLKDDEEEIIQVKGCRTAKLCINWVEKNFQNWTEKAWE